MQFSYDARPSFWQEVRSNSHLVIAAVGTAALLGVAGTALWLAMPAGDRQAFAQAEEPAPVSEPVAKADPVEIKATSEPALASVEPGAPKAGAPPLHPADTDVDLEALPANDPRWSGSTHKQARAPVESVAQAKKEAEPVAAVPPPLPTPEQAASVAAYQPTRNSPDDTADHAKPDKAETAAIPAAKPAKPAADDDAADDGHILRAVTMRSGPKKGAAAIGTIPAKAAVQVMSCKSWCQVVYKGKRGWIYKSFLKRD
jgi:hypothetical protein